MPTFAEAEVALKARGYTDANVEENSRRTSFSRPSPGAVAARSSRSRAAS